MNGKYIILIIIVMLVISTTLAGCNLHSNVSATQNPTDVETTRPIGTPQVEPPPFVQYGNYEQLAQAIKSEDFFNSFATYGDLPQSIKVIIQETNIIKLKVNEEELAFDRNETGDKCPVTVYWPYPYGNDYYHGYLARHSYNGQFVFVQVWYSKFIPEQNPSPTLNYDAVINGENARIHYQVDGERHSGYFDYKDGHYVLIMTYDKETFDYIFSHLSIEEISVK